MLNALKLSLRSIRYYWRNALAVIAGVVVTTIVLAGSLLVGDSVRSSLHMIAAQRLGNIQFAIFSPGRYFDAELAEALNTSGLASSALKLQGTLRVQDGGETSRQLNRVEVIGADPWFENLSHTRFMPPEEGEIAISEKVAAALELAPGDEVSLRVAKPTLLPRDAPLSSRQGRLTTRGLLTVSSIVPDSALGRFSLDGSQMAPNNVFVNPHWLRNKVGLDGKANLLAVGNDIVDPSRVAQLQWELTRAWRPEHSGIHVRVSREASPVTLLESDRVFLDPAIATACLDANPEAVGALTYLVNTIETDAGRKTPYSFVVGTSPSDGHGPVPMGMADDEVIINRWLADELEIDTGGKVRMSYFELGPGNELIERERPFRVREVLDMSAFTSERLYAPAFPGLTDVDSCKQWDIGMPMDEELLADEANEAYWEQYRETPKAIVTLSAAQAMWANRFGNLSQVRYPGDRSGDVKTLLQNVDPSDLGLVFLPVGELALRGVEESMSFGELFVSMSFFLIIAAMVLTGLLFVLGIQQRSTEAGVLKALGYRRGQVLRAYLAEGAALAALGCVVGAILAPLYTQALIWGLSTHWQGAVAGSAIRFHQEPATLLTGTVSAFVAAMIALVLAVRRHAKLSARELISGEARGYDEGAGRKSRFPIVSSLLLLAALILVGSSSRADTHQLVMIFFGAGFLLLLSGIGFARMWLRRMSLAESSMSLARLGVRNAGRVPARSLSVIGLLAGGAFIVLAVSSMQEDMTANADKSWSGTGGFDLYASSTVPVPDALNSDEARERFGLRDEIFDSMELVSIKEHAGDDASCFNLNRAQAPILLGVGPADLSEQGAFQAKGSVEDPWRLLETELPDDVIPALAGDANTAMWGLEKSVGTVKGGTIAYRDERGEVFEVKLVGALPTRLSVFQGRVLISAKHFVERFPSEEGYRVFLAKSPDPDALRHALTRKLERVGLEVQPASQRLAEFYSVESSYLRMFLVLGGLGVLLGSIGLGVVLMRNVLERRGEFAVLRAVGYSRPMVNRVVIAEHWALVIFGLAIGLVAALVSMWPNLRSASVEIPLGWMLMIVVGLLAIGLGWTALAARSALRGGLVDALRRE